ncbi:hypothetical protein HMF8227_01136 [Saliniradius amylolyticus]|uniref:Uncharacterized protein n=1 Tax=Saliniradius amylolyticus TaxID=2183582 RepID=A0A2S2E3L6_9ALTE|nr:hypothetical protein HMF8227_01136 [Saliniradius amylolyticus]
MFFLKILKKIVKTLFYNNFYFPLSYKKLPQGDPAGV